MIEIKSLEQFYDCVESDQLSIVYFYTTWCPDCFSVKRYIQVLESDFPNITFYSFDRDTNIELAKHLEIYGIPSFIMFFNGDELSRYVDKRRKSYEQVKIYIENSLK